MCPKGHFRWLAAFGGTAAPFLCSGFAVYNTARDRIVSDGRRSGGEHSSWSDLMSRARTEIHGTTPLPCTTNRQSSC